MRLTQWQNQFLLSVNGSHSQALLEASTGAGELNSEQAMSVYQNTCFGSRINALCGIYSSCKKVLGDSYFRQLAKGYIRENGSQDFPVDLNTCGQHFNDYVNEQVKSRDELFDFKYLPELARLDWCIYQLQDVGDDPCSDRALLSRAEQRVFRLSRECSVFCSDYPVDRIWALNMAHSNENAVEHDSAPFYIVIQRQHYKIKLKRLNTITYNMLRQLEEPKTISSWIDQLDRNTEHFSDRLSEVIQQEWLRWI